MFRTSLPVLILRLALFLPLFFFGCVSCVIQQYISILFYGHGPKSWLYINKTRSQFVVIMTFLTQIVNPCKISITYDQDLIPPGAFKVDMKNNLHLILTPNSIVIGNHQIYIDWLFLWWIAYTSRLSDSIYIVMKDLSKLPLLGYGMTNFNFLFLSRKWEKDKVKLTNQLLEIDANARGLGPACGESHVSATNIRDGDAPETSSVFHWPKGHRSSNMLPYQVILYPEGTVILPHTRERLAKFCQDRGLPVLKHVLLPRIRGLFLALRKLRNTVEVVYDVTCGYDGLRPDQYGEDEFTLKQIYLRGNGPKKVSYYIKAWKIKDIPLGAETVDIDDVSPADFAKFEEWLFKIWYEKDTLMANFYQYGSFVDPMSSSTNTIEKARSTTVVADFKIRSVWELFPVYLPLVLVALLLLVALWGAVTLIRWLF